MRVAAALCAYQGRALLILSGADLTAQEFETSVLESKPIKAWLAQGERMLLRLEGANHTYSKAAWRERVHQVTRDWLLEDL